MKIVQAVFGEGSFVLGQPPVVRGFRPKVLSAPPPPSTSSAAAEGEDLNSQQSSTVSGGPVGDSSAQMMDVDSPSPFDWPCRWGHGPEPRVPPCSSGFSSRNELFEHIRRDHLPEGLSFFSCEWFGCKRLPQCDRREQVISHVGIHLLEISKSKQLTTLGGGSPTQSPTSPTKASSALPAPPAQGPTRPIQGQGQPQGQGQGHPLYPDPHDELRGIPLTSLLILRNLARHPDNRSMYYPFETQLAALVAQPRYSKLVSSILAELIR
jgi:hypothetical protein